MAVEAQLVVGPIGPDTIQIPGEPQRLRRAAESLRDLCQQLDDVGQQLRRADAPEGGRGRTVRSLSRVAGRTGQTLQADSDTLRQLGDAVQHQAELLSQAHDHLDELRATWRQARHDLRDAVQGDQNRRQAADADHEASAAGGRAAGGAKHEQEPLNVSALIHDLDAEAAAKHGQAITGLSGIHFDGAGGTQQTRAMLVDGDLDRALTTYRHQVEQVLADLTESMRRVHRADEEMAQHLRRNDTAVAQAHLADGDGTAAGQAPAISSPEDIRSVAQQVRQAAQSIDQAADQLREIRLGIREGRMLPDDDRIGSSDGFQRSWTAHFDDLRQDLNHARTAGIRIADRLREIDDDGARDVHRSGRTGDGQGS